MSTSPPTIRRITIDKLRVQASIGILSHELKARQPLLVTLIADVPGPLMPAHDSVDDVFDYRHLRGVVLEEVARGHVNMIETLCARVAERVLAQPAISRVLVRIGKPNVFPDCDGVSVEVDVSRQDLENRP
ncbi:MAG TPA: dihydroneopterin aldolase [Ideonella sp.]|nr:dihydroneopterin aldolase [Ideonella sp.]